MSDVCGWASRRFLRFSRLSPVHAPRKLTAAAKHGDRMAQARSLHSLRDFRRKADFRAVRGQKLRGEEWIPIKAAVALQFKPLTVTSGDDRVYSAPVWRNAESFIESRNTEPRRDRCHMP